MFAFGGPVVHLAHSNPGRALASFGVRVGMTLLCGGIGTALHDEDFSGTALGGGVGMLGAATIDAAALAREQVPDQVAARPGFRLLLEHGGAGLIVNGAF